MIHDGAPKPLPACMHNTRTHVHARKHTCVGKHAHAHTRTTHTRTHARTRTRAHTHTHAHTHAHAHRPENNPVIFRFTSIISLLLRTASTAVHYRFPVAPEVRLKNYRIGQKPHKDTILECQITAYPMTINYWQKDGRQLSSSTKYRLDAYDEQYHTITLSLRIMDLDESDYGEYVCGAENRLGADKGTMKLYRKCYFKLHEFRRFCHCNSCETYTLNLIELSCMLNNNQEALRLTNR